MIEPKPVTAAILGACKADPPLAAPRAAGCTVDHVIDGDTIVVSCDTNHVRLLAINTPEIAHPGQLVECGGSEAKAYGSAFNCL